MQQAAPHFYHDMKILNMDTRAVDLFATLTMTPISAGTVSAALLHDAGVIGHDARCFVDEAVR